jgi:enediyne biosynthesis protein E4
MNEIAGTAQTAMSRHMQQRHAAVGRAVRWSMLVFVILGIAIAVLLWLQSRPVPEPVQQETSIPLPQISAPSTVAVPHLPFTDVTKSAGILFSHENGADGEKLLPETMGSGCAFFDFDNDGDQDILLVNSMRWNWDERPREQPATMALYRNDGLGQFDDATAEAGLDVSFYGMGVATGDMDNDGYVDLFLTAVGSNHLYRNIGGRFVEITDTAGVAGSNDAWSTSAGWFDYDNDGDLDLFVCNYVVWSRESDLAQGFQLTGVGRAYGRPIDFPGTFPYLYRNEGGGVFVDVSEPAGVCVQNSATGGPMAKSLGVAFVDFDLDGWIDVVVANDTVQNFLFHNQGNGTFHEIGTLTGVAFDVDGNARGAMGIDTGHFRNNTDIGIAIGNFANEMTALYVCNDQSMQFADEAVPVGLGAATRQRLTFGVCFADFDLDGRLDLFAANGHLETDINTVQASQFYEQPPQLFWNCGSLQPDEFLHLTAGDCGADFGHPMVGRGASIGDIDGDGDLDLLITASDGPPRLLRNGQTLQNHWLRIKLVGTQCNRDAIGSRVEVHVGDEILTRHVKPTRGYLSQSELPVTVGLGPHRIIDLILIHWADGTTQKLAAPDVDRMLLIEQPTE